MSDRFEGIDTTLWVPGALEDYRQHVTSPKELRRHIKDAAMAHQVPRPTRAQWLAKCERVKEARAKLVAVPNP